MYKYNMINKNWKPIWKLKYPVKAWHLFSAHVPSARCQHCSRSARPRRQRGRNSCDAKIPAPPSPVSRKQDKTWESPVVFRKNIRKNHGNLMTPMMHDGIWWICVKKRGI